jgi:hypothetical protein
VKSKELKGGGAMKKKKNLFLVGIVTFCLVFPLTSIGAEKKTPKKYPDIVKQMVGKAKKSLHKSIDMTAFKAVVDSKDYDLIVDVREPVEYEDGYVAGAINIPRGLLEFTIWKKVGFPDNTILERKSTSIVGQVDGQRWQQRHYRILVSPI